jgi:hypothetical protein
VAVELGSDLGLASFVDAGAHGARG